mmetsp:Transcript_11768/g.17829  ORF Transcript_11768/g.17829 Transcript_11768/m.17829 type:complete len:81 (+) Transcript_11768:140-382(+)
MKSVTLQLHPLGAQEISPQEQEEDSCSSPSSCMLAFSRPRLCYHGQGIENNKNKKKRYVYHRDPRTGHSIRTLIRTVQFS